MHVVVLHNFLGDTVAVVARVDTIGQPYTEIDKTDSTGYIGKNPQLGADIRHIFQDVLGHYGIVQSSPMPDEEIIEPIQELNS